MNKVLLLSFMIVIFVVVINLAYQVFKMVEIDAESRGLKHPKLWGFFSLGGNNGGGLLVYLLGRRKYKLSLSDEDKMVMQSRKKKAAVSLVFIAVCLIGMLAVGIFTF